MPLFMVQACYEGNGGSHILYTGVVDTPTKAEAERLADLARYGNYNDPESSDGDSVFPYDISIVVAEIEKVVKNTLVALYQCEEIRKELNEE